MNSLGDERGGTSAIRRLTKMGAINGHKIDYNGVAKINSSNPLLPPGTSRLQGIQPQRFNNTALQ